MRILGRIIAAMGVLIMLAGVYLFFVTGMLESFALSSIGFMIIKNPELIFFLIGLISLYLLQAVSYLEWGLSIERSLGLGFVSLLIFTIISILLHKSKAFKQ